MAVARILVGVTGGIAAYKACELVRLLVRAGHDVTPITTRAAERFVAADTFWALARKTEPADPYLSNFIVRSFWCSCERRPLSQSAGPAANGNCRPRHSCSRLSR